MKIQYCSDLHLEFQENKNYLKRFPKELTADLVIIIVTENKVKFGLQCFLQESFTEEVQTSTSKTISVNRY